LRTTIEMRDDHRARLLALAARRGRKGFSDLVAEAIEAYLAAEGEREAEVRDALSLRGSLPAAAAERLRGEVARLRKEWR
jgi:hypothetical protein